jgi:hypothetical protein
LFFSVNSLTRSDLFSGFPNAPVSGLEGMLGVDGDEEVGGEELYFDSLEGFLRITGSGDVPVEEPDGVGSPAEIDSMSSWSSASLASGM